MARTDECRPFPAFARALGVAWVALAVALLAAWTAVPALASYPPPTPSPQVSYLAEEEVEGEETEEEEEFEVDGGGEWVQLEEEPDEEGEGDGEAGIASALPPECLLRGARSRVIVDPAHAMLRLALHYQAASSIRIGAVFRLQGAKGSLRLGATTRRSTRSGTLHLNRHLGPRALDKARAARVVLVRIDVLATPPYCHLTMRVATQHTAG
jgi:hypothetical protein